MTEERLAVIPARGGSSRLPRKNVRELGGRPLIAWTIEAALGAGLFARVVVSTDDEAIADIAREHGAEVPFLRARSLADGHTPVSLVAVDALARLDEKARVFHSVALLLPNCPLRTAEDVRNSHRQFVETGADAQISVTRFGWLNPWWAMRREGDFRLRPLFKTQAARRSQDLAPLFCPTGAIWWAKAQVLRREKTFHAAGHMGWELDWQRAVDIDTEEDWRLAELLVEARLARAAR